MKELPTLTVYTPSFISTTYCSNDRGPATQAYQRITSKVVCGRHEFVFCRLGNVDHSFMTEDRERQDLVLGAMNSFEPQWGISSLDNFSGDRRKCSQSVVKGTGRTIPTIFTPPISPGAASPSLPATLFPPAMNMCSFSAPRFINSTRKDQVLIYTDGACLNNGQVNARAGWAFVFGPGKAVVGCRLETRGPFDDTAQAQTSNRAELRAVIAVLGFRYWPGEGFASLVIATDSEYVVKGATSWAKDWVANGWKISNGVPVKNKDLWELLLAEFERWERQALEVVFWRIGRELNTVADAAAKKAATELKDEDTWMPISGVMC